MSRALLDSELQLSLSEARGYKFGVQKKKLGTDWHNRQTGYLESVLVKRQRLLSSVLTVQGKEVED